MFFMSQDEQIRPEDEQHLMELEELLQGLDDLKPSIRRSELSETEKLKYLTLIETGAFSLEDFDALIEAMEQADERSLRKADEEIIALQQKSELLEQQLAELRVQSALEKAHNLEKLEAALKKESSA